MPLGVLLLLLNFVPVTQVKAFVLTLTNISCHLYTGHNESAIVKAVHFVTEKDQGPSVDATCVCMCVLLPGPWSQG